MFDWLIALFTFFFPREAGDVRRKTQDAAWSYVMPVLVVICLIVVILLIAYRLKWIG